MKGNPAPMRIVAGFVVSCHMSILMLTMTLRNFIPAILAKKMLHMREQVPGKTTAEIGRFFRSQVYPKILADVSLGMAYLMHKSIEELLCRGSLAHHHNSSPIPGTCIGQPCVYLPLPKVAESITHSVHIRTYRQQISENEVGIRIIRVDVCLDKPVVLMDMERMRYHRNIPQSTGFLLRSILAYQQAMTSPSPASGSSISIFTYMA